MICLDKFTKENGAMKIWLKSHLSGVRIHHEKNKFFGKKNNYKFIVFRKAL